MKTVLLQSSRLVSVVLFMLYGMSMFAQRQDILLNNDWNFRFSHQVQKGTEVRVDLPHTWNAQDALSGKIDYKRGIGNYEKNLFIRPEWKGKRLFIRFEGVNNIADVFINRRHICKPGIAPFKASLTDTTGRSPKTSSIFTLLTAPVRFAFFCTP